MAVTSNVCQDGFEEKGEGEEVSLFSSPS
jgi:hypothetical protein